MQQNDPVRDELQRDYKEGSQRLLGRAGFLNQVGFSWNPLSTGLEIRFHPQEPEQETAMPKTTISESRKRPNDDLSR